MSEETAYRRILAIDTASRVQSVALVDDGQVLEHMQRRVKFDHGSTLLDNLSEILAAHQMHLVDLDLIVCGLGPGSFTGLRVGLAIAKSLARGAEVPIKGVSTLAATALPWAEAHPSAAVCAALDARRKEAYTGTWRLDGGRLKPVDAERTARPEALADRLREATGEFDEVVLVGDAAQKYPALAQVAQAGVRVLPGWLAPPSAVSLAVLGGRLAQAHGADDLAQLEPNYIRPTDAEISLAERQSGAEGR